MSVRGEVALLAAGAGLFAGAVVHVAAYMAGPYWVAVLGAPPSVVASTRTGTWPALVGTAAIAALLLALGACCLSAAGRIRRLPLDRAVLSIFAVIFVLRGLLALPVQLTGRRAWTTPVGRFVANGPLFVPASIIVLAIGLLIATGLATTRSHRAPRAR